MLATQHDGMTVCHTLKRLAAQAVQFLYLKCVCTRDAKFPAVLQFHDKERFAEYLHQVKKGEKTIKAGALKPHQLVHEAMHALVAWKGGDPTAYHGGQVSLSPIPHIRREPIGMLVVPLLTAFTQGWAMGWASAPYDPVWAERHPKRAALMQ